MEPPASQDYPVVAVQQQNERRDAAPVEQKHVVSAGAAPPTSTKLSEEDLRLIQLCFDEHEFGVLLDHATDAGLDPQTGGSMTSAPVDTSFFDPVRFVSEKLSHGVSLDILCKDLDFYSTYVEKKIAQHVNTEMKQAYVDVSGHLVAMENELQLVEKPLSACIYKLGDSCKALSDIEQQVSSKLQRATETELEIAFEETYIQCLLFYSNLVIELKALGSRVQALESMDASLFVGLPRALFASIESAAVSTWQLKKMVEDNLPLLPLKEKEMEECQGYKNAAMSALLEALQRVFVLVASAVVKTPKEQLTNGLPPESLQEAANEVMSIYVQLNETKEFCRMFREEVLRPFAEKIVTWKAATQARQDTEETVSLLYRLEMGIEESILPLVQMARSVFPNLNPSSSIVWPALSEVLVKKLVSLYEVGIPSTFFKKYKAAFRLLALCERLCESLEELEAFRSSADVSLWIHKWNTDVYVALQSAEVDKRLTKALEAFSVSASVVSSADLSTNQESRYKFAPFAVLEQQMTRLFSQDVLLHVCVPKFLRVFVASVRKVTASGLRQSKVTTESGQPPPPPLPADAAHGGGETATLKTEFLLHFISDARTFQTFIRTTFTVQLENVLGPATLQSLDWAAKKDNLLAQVLLLTSDHLSQCVDEMQTVLCEQVLQTAYSALQNIKTVRTTFSFTKKMLPSEPSWYVPAVVEPIAFFSRRLQENKVQPNMIVELTHYVAGHVTHEFNKLAQETLVIAKKTEERLEKLRKRKEGATEGLTLHTAASPVSPGEGPRVTPETVSDRDKMCIQLWVDAKAYVKQLIDQGIVAAADEQDPLFAELFATLRRAEWLMGAPIPEPAELADLTASDA